MRSAGLGSTSITRVLLATACCLLPCASAWAEILAVQDVEIVARLTGAESINQTHTVGIGGTDLGHMVNLDGRTYFLFGDTFSGDNPYQGGCWRWNVMAYSTDTDPSDGILFDGWITATPVCGHPDWARQVIDSGVPDPPRITEIPTGAVSLGDRIYAWYMSVNWWGPPGEWTANYGGLAYWEVGDPSFTVVPGFQFPGSGNFCMIAASLRTDLPPGEDDHLYVWGTPAGRLGGVKLARVSPDSVTDLSAYEYFAGLDAGGQPTWVTDEFDAPLIVEPTVGEMSVMYNPAVCGWTLLYLNHATWAIEIREARDPWGPWSAPVTVATGFDLPGGLYGSYMNPLYVEDGGRTIYFTMSLWDPYDVFLVGATLDVTTPIGDCDCDGDADGDDFTDLAACLEGPGGVLGDACGCFDLDDDGDVDLTDFATFQVDFTGP